ncbi:hypothetical protein DV737_g2810, partial [Chaetothyriales sp. CBS 132003]
MNTSRLPDMSPMSMGGSEWSGMSNYNNSGSRSETSYHGFINGAEPSFQPDSDSSNTLPLFRQNNFSPLSGEPLRNRRPSESGSLSSSRVVSTANSRSSDGTISDVQSRKYRRMEMEVHQHYNVLRGYLKGGAQPPPRPNKARDKLLRLSPVQFHELSTDVFDELQRRQASAPLPGRPPRRDVPPFLQPRPDFHEKRNQARQKLSSLQTSRFRDLSTDVFCEIERRFPHFGRAEGPRPASRGQGGRMQGPRGSNAILPAPRAGPPTQPANGVGPHSKMMSQGGVPMQEGQNGDFGRPMARQFQSNTITPNKSMMVEDEDDMPGPGERYDRSSDAFGLESALATPSSDRNTSATSQSLASMVGKPSPAQVAEMQQEIDQLKEGLRLKEAELQRKDAGESDRQEREELRKQIEDLQLSNKNLKTEVEKAQSEFSETERSLRAELGQARDLSLLEQSSAEILRENELLKRTLKEQQETIDDVHEQGRRYLEEMRAMADSGSGDLEREQKLAWDVHRLEEEVKEWKAKYVKAKAQLRNVRASSLGVSISRPDLNPGGRDAALYAETGAVQDVHITSFQIAIDELLQVARSQPASVLDHIKAVVTAARAIMADVDNASDAVNDEEVLKKRTRLKSKVSVTANNVITASKNYAAAGGLSPVSLLDAAASHLATAVVDLVHMVQIKPTPTSELENDDEPAELLPSTDYFNITDGMRSRSALDSVYGALSTPDAEDGADGPGPSMQSLSSSSYEYKSSNGPLKDQRFQPDYGLRLEDSDLEDLKIYVENQSDELIASVQVLIEAIRGEAPMQAIRSNLDKIVGTVDNVQAAVAKGSEAATTYQSQWRADTTLVSENLDEYKAQLLQASVESTSYEQYPAAKEFIQKLPPLAFQVARETQELVRRVDAIRTRDDDDAIRTRDDDDFS